jgi:hypothetical protein
MRFADAVERRPFVAEEAVAKPPTITPVAADPWFVGAASPALESALERFLAGSRPTVSPESSVGWIGGFYRRNGFPAVDPPARLRFSS